jgi:hypothetical protein
MSFGRLLPALFAAFALSALSGCASEPEESDAESSANAVTPVSPATPITLEDWERHPTILEIDAIAKEIDLGIILGTVRHTQRENLCNGASGDDMRTKWMEDQSLRKLVLGFGPDEAYRVASYHYDTSGKLRYIAQTFDDDVSGGGSQYLVYFDSDGNPIWHVLRERDLEASVDEGRPEVPGQRYGAWFVPASLDHFELEDPRLATDPLAVYESAPNCHDEPEGGH